MIKLNFNYFIIYVIIYAILHYKMSFNELKKQTYVWREICRECNIKHSVYRIPQCSNYITMFNSTMKQLLKTIPRDTHRKVCKGCHKIGHNMKDVSCKLNIKKHDLLKNKIKNYMLSQDCLSGKTNDEHFDDLSNMYGISVNMCKNLYMEISPIELTDRNSDIKLYVDEIKQNKSLKCYKCTKIIYNIHVNTHRKWKDNELCDSCWSDYGEERELLWKHINDYRKIQCYICSSIKEKEGERYHYDHINMFDKGKSICSMVAEGNTIDEIYGEIDKCQILCLSCHHIVTDIENKLCFTRIKQQLTRKLNNSEITNGEYRHQKIKIGEIYVRKIYEIYNELKSCIS